MTPDKDLIWNTVYATSFALIRCSKTSLFGMPTLDETAHTAAALACEAVNRLPRLDVAGGTEKAQPPADAPGREEPAR